MASVFKSSIKLISLGSTSPALFNPSYLASQGQKRFKTSSAQNLRKAKKDTDDHPFVQNLIKSGVSSDLNSRITPSGKNDGVYVVDCFYRNLPGTAAAFMLKEDNQAAFFDNNTLNALPVLLQSLTANGLTPDQVKYIILSHIHLDHAGCTAALAEACKNATILCHPRAVKHLVNPTKIVEGVRRAYGYNLIEELFTGEKIKGIPIERIRPVAHGERIVFGKREFEFTHVLGHARHHILLHDLTHKSLYTGDSFGVSYQPFVNKFIKNPSPNNDTFLFPTTAPTDFDANEEWRVLDQIETQVKQRNVEYAYLTHFGVWNDMKKGINQLRLGYLYHSNLTLEYRNKIQQEVFRKFEAKSLGKTYEEKAVIARNFVTKKDGTELPYDHYFEEEYLPEVMATLKKFWFAQLKQGGVDVDDQLLNLHLQWDCVLNASGILNASIRDLLTYNQVE